MFCLTAGWLPRHPRFALEGDPFLERFTVTLENPERDAAVSVCFRVRPSADEGDWDMNPPVVGSE